MLLSNVIEIIRQGRNIESKHYITKWTKIEITLFSTTTKSIQKKLIKFSAEN
jgi:hypothetical protein